MPNQTLIDVDSFRATASGFTFAFAGQPREFRDEDVVGLSVRKERVVATDGTAKIIWISP